MKKALPILGLVALVITIFISYLSNTGVFGGNTMASVSARYHSLFTPAPYAFSIWGLIYLELLAFSFYQIRSLAGNAEAIALVDRVGWWFVLSSLANSCWVLAWLYDYTGLSVLIMGFLFFSLIKIIQRTDMELTDPPLRTIAFVWWPFCFYSGWISVALLANIAAWLVKIGPPAAAAASDSPVVPVLFILLAAVVHLYMTWARNMREFAMVGVWALIAIGIANHHGSALVRDSAFIVAAMLFFSSSYHGYKNRAKGPFRRRTA